MIIIVGIIERSVASFGITFIYQFTPSVIVSIAALFTLLVSQREIFYSSDLSEVEKKARKRVTAGLACITAISLIGTLVVYNNLTSLLVILFGVSVAFGIALCYSKKMNLWMGLRMLLAKDIRVIHTLTRGTKQTFSKSGLMLIMSISITLLTSDAAINALILPASSGLTFGYVLPFKNQSTFYVLSPLLLIMILFSLLIFFVCLSMRFYLSDSSKLSLNDIAIEKLAKAGLMVLLVHSISFILLVSVLIIIDYIGFSITDFSFYMSSQEAFRQHFIFLILLVAISIAFSIVFVPFDILAGTTNIQNSISNSVQFSKWNLGALFCLHLYLCSVSIALSSILLIIFILITSNTIPIVLGSVLLYSTTGFLITLYTSLIGEGYREIRHSHYI